MADISSYPLGSPKLTDLIVGSETYSAAVNPPVYGNPTRNFSISDISSLSPQGTVTSIGIAANNGAGTTITVSGSHSFLGTANQINTSVAGTVVTFAFPTDVVVPRDFTVTRQLNVGGESSLTGTLNMNAAKIANLQNPTLAQDAATKAYVDGASGVGGTAGTIPIFDATGLGDSQMTYVNNQFIVNASSKFQTGWIRISAAGATDGYLEVLGSLGTQGQVLTSGASQLAQWTTLDITGTAGALAIYAADGSLSDSLITFTGNMFTVASTAKFKTGWLRLSDAGETTGYLEAKGSLGTLGQVLSSGADQLAEWKTLALDFLPLAGGTVTGQINGITPTAAANLTTKGYVDASLGYKAYAALLVQSGAGAPVATVMQNTTSGTIAWSRNSSGNYSGVITGDTFTVDKTLVFINQGGSTSTANISWGSSTTTISVITGADDLLAKASIEIRIYA